MEVHRPWLGLAVSPDVEQVYCSRVEDSELDLYLAPKGDGP